MTDAKRFVLATLVVLLVAACVLATVANAALQAMK